MSANADKLCIDLCSGLGGFSQAFVDAGWEVVTVDIDPRFQPTICANIINVGVTEIEARTRLKLIEYESVVVLASPPCQANSIANARAWLSFMPIGLAVAAACVRIIRDISVVRTAYGDRETVFCLENPRGRLRWFAGKPRSMVRLKNYGKRTSKPTDLWHNIQFAMLQEIKEVKSKEGKHKQRREIWMSEIERSPSKRALMPLGLSQAILEAISAPPSGES